VPRLRGLGREIPLGVRAVLGRDPGCDVVLDDASVSRRHALLVADGKGGCRLRDLASANGTFLDGVRIGQNGVPIPGGARLRFGDVELQLVEDAAAPLLPRRRALLAAGAVTMVAFAALLLRGRPSGAAAASSPAPPATALVEDSVAALEADRFEEAEALAEKAVEADPLLDAARAALARSRREREAARVYAQAMAAADAAGNDALHLLARVPQDSRLFARARIQAKQIAGAALRARGAACGAESNADFGTGGARIHGSNASTPRGTISGWHGRRAGSMPSSGIFTCPSCTVDQCDLGCDTTTGTCKPADVSTPCGDTDGNTCTTAGR